MSIINSNAKNNALKLLRRYTNPHECWTGLKTRYESDSGPRRVMLIDKFFALRKTDSISMDSHLTEVKEVANQLEEVEVVIPEDIIVYYTLKNLPKEYEIFKRMQIAAQTLPTYEQLEAKLISEETAIRMETQQKEEGEALFLHQDRTRRPQFPPRFGHSSSNPRHHYNNRRHNESGGMTTPKYPHHTAATRYSQHTAAATHSGAAQQGRSSTVPQNRYRSKEPDRQRGDRCNFCGLNGHFERECDLRSILDRIKDYEQRLLE